MPELMVTPSVADEVDPASVAKFTAPPEIASCEPTALVVCLVMFIVPGPVLVRVTLF